MSHHRSRIPLKNGKSGRESKDYRGRRAASAAVLLALGCLGLAACTTSPVPPAAAPAQSAAEQPAPSSPAQDPAATAAGTSAGMSAGTDGSAGVPPASASGDATASGGSVTVDDSGNALPAAFPSGFPLPPGAHVTLAQENDGDGPQFALDRPEPKAILDFYRTALPAAGYQITHQTFVGDGTDHPTGTLSFAGHQVTGAIDLAPEMGALTDFKSLIRLDG
ncbi:hypothetical protein AB0O07_18435 [Streptomyces sp. NPDC093085]|uniref:hypothetical protein n=1 Tax=Streptomyces sp. NPDC093085 TaxID=3155068 RepID=UPI003432B37E